MTDRLTDIPTAPARLDQLIGNTPLLAFPKLGREVAPVAVYAKAEWYNPGGSVKDRAALAMILDGERTGRLTKDKILLDATSGNTGIAYAMICAQRGYRVKLCLPLNASRERKQTLLAYGVELQLTDPTEGTDGAQTAAKKLAAAEPDKYFYPDQYNNPANWRAHYETTAMEIWRQTNGQVTHFVAGLGTTGTFTGVTRRLKELNPSIQCVSMQPDGPLHGLEGLKHLETAIVPGIYDPSLGRRAGGRGDGRRAPTGAPAGARGRMFGRRQQRGEHGRRDAPRQRAATGHGGDDALRLGGEVLERRLLERAIGRRRRDLAMITRPRRRPFGGQTFLSVARDQKEPSYESHAGPESKHRQSRRIETMNVRDAVFELVYECALRSRATDKNVCPPNSAL